jgi:hypothetical protein
MSGTKKSGLPPLAVAPTQMATTQTIDGTKRNKGVLDPTVLEERRREGGDGFARPRRADSSTRGGR